MKPSSRLALHTCGFELQSNRALKQANSRTFLANKSKERTMLLAVERFILPLKNRYGNHPVSTDDGTWYPQACRFLKL